MGRSRKGPTISGKRISDNTHDITYGKSGNRSLYRQVVSQDGKTMTVTNSGRDAQGNTVNSTEVYHRGDDTQVYRK